MRKGIPLPGKTPAQLMSQLTHRVLGPLRPHRILAVLAYHGLRDAPATTQARIAARYGVTERSVTKWVAEVKAAGARLPLSPGMAAQISRRSRTGEDHLGRTRIAFTFGLPPPAAPHPPPAGRPRFTLAQQAASRTAIQVLATVGPLTMPELLAAVRRTRRFREQSPPMTGDQLADALQHRHATLADGLWHAPAGTAVLDRYRHIAATLTGRELRRHELIEVLTGAGYTPASAGGRIVDTHPLITRTGPNRYRLIQHTHPSAFTDQHRKTRSMDQQPNSTDDRAEPDFLDELVARGQAIPPAESGMPDLIPDLLPEVDSLSDLLIAERDHERNSHP